MLSDFESALEPYAELVVDIGLNIQPGQRLLIGVPIHNQGAPLDSAPLVRRIATHAYRRGARRVDVLWGDDQVHRARFEHAPDGTFHEFPHWKAQALLDTVWDGRALLTILASDPDLLAGVAADRISTYQQAVLEQTAPAMAYVTRNAINWCVITYPLAS